MSDDTAAIILQNPNFFGAIDDHSDIIDLAHSKGILAIESVYPISLGLLKTPGAMGADIVTGEGQSLGNYLSFGGPYLGFLGTRKKFVRNMPGRIVGKTEDVDGSTGYVLTLQTREQHIRRQSATSNISGIYAQISNLDNCRFFRSNSRELAIIYCGGCSTAYWFQPFNITPYIVHS